MEGPTSFRALLAPWVDIGWVKIVEDEIRFKNGSKIFLCHCQDSKDVYKYWSAEFHVLLIDELTSFDEDMYRYLRSRVRLTKIEVPEEYKGQFPRILCASNPMQDGHDWVQRTWIDYAPPYQIYKTPPEEGGMRRQFLPSTLDDNPSLLEADPDYENRILGASLDPAIRKALRYGDWNVTPGAFFDNFRRDQHVITPFYIPRDWARGMAMDYGSSEPCAILYYAIVPDEFSEGPSIPSYAQHNYQGQLPRNSIVIYREIYLTKQNMNEGLNRTSQQIAQVIIEAEENEPRPDLSKPRSWDNLPRLHRTAGVDIWNWADGPNTIANRFSAAPYFLDFEKAITKKSLKYGEESGWMEIRQRLVGTCQLHPEGYVDWTTGRPSLFMFDVCTNLIRTLPKMQHDKNYRENMAAGEDHLCDSLRYICQRHRDIRPMKDYTPKREPVISFGIQTQIDTSAIDLFNMDNDKREYKKPTAKNDRIY